MQSKNPIFARSEEFTRGGYATFDAPSSDRRATSGAPGTYSDAELQGMYDAPSASPAQAGRMTLDDVVVRTAAMFALLLTTAGISFFMNLGLLPVIGAAIVGFVLVMVVSFSKTVRPGLILAYAAVEGVFVGGISNVYADTFGQGVVPQAILGTLAAFSGMLLAYRTGIIRNSPTFQRTLMIAAVGYFIFMIGNLVAQFAFGMESVYQQGLLGVAVSAFGVVLASLFLVLDFDYIEKGIANGLPERYAWMGAFGLVVTLVWLYVEILRLVSILQSGD